MYTITNADYDACSNANKNGAYSTWGQGRTGPKKWKDASKVHASLKGVKMVSHDLRRDDT